jgi:hypothetical protein
VAVVGRNGWGDFTCPGPVLASNGTSFANKKALPPSAAPAGKEKVSGTFSGRQRPKKVPDTNATKIGP